MAVTEEEEEEAIHPRSSVANRPFGSSAEYVAILRRRRRGRVAQQRPGARPNLEYRDADACGEEGLQNLG